MGGLAVTLAPVVALNPVPGLQLYVVEPLAFKVALVVGQIVALFTVIVEVGIMVTVVVALAVGQAPEDPVTVYTVVVFGFAFTVVPTVLLNPVPGLHAYVAAPLAVKVVVAPAHIAAGVLTVTVNEGTTVTVAVATGIHPPPPPLPEVTV